MLKGVHFLDIQGQNLSLRLTNQEFHLLRDLIHRQYGISLSEQKRALMLGRLSQVVQQLGLSNFGQYYQHVLRDPTDESLTTLANCISTNHTFFYREPQHYDFLRQVALPNLQKAAQIRSEKKLRIWCAGCSSGEEPYTLSIVLHDFFREQAKEWDIGILATDISNQVLQAARTGCYAEENVANVPAELRSTFFQRVDESCWQVKAQVREPILFRRLNLMQEHFPFRGKLDFIFCRNVMIYFDSLTKGILLDKFFRFTRPGGYLFVGHSEALGHNRASYQYVQPAIYRKEGAA